MVTDTSDAAQEVQDRVVRAMSAEDRVATAAEMSEAAFDIARVGISIRHPDFTPRQVVLTEFRARLGADLFDAAFPGERTRLRDLD